MLHRLTRFASFVFLFGTLLALSGCLYDNAPSGPVKDIDTWLVGQWATQDKAGHQFTAVVSPVNSDHYKVEFRKQGAESLEFDGWISRVDNFSILVLKSLNQDSSFGKFALYHYELLAPGAPPPGGIGAKRIRLSELQLDESTRSLDSYRLRGAIRKALQEGTLLLPYDFVAELKSEGVEQSIIALETSAAASMAELKQTKMPEATQKKLALLREQAKSLKREVPGSIVWTKTGGVTLKGETF